MITEPQRSSHRGEYAGSAAAPSPDSSQDERLVHGITASAPCVPYTLYLPRRGRQARTTLVAVHGISRNSQDYARELVPLADRQGACIVAPHFSKAEFRGYQRPGTGATRADLALDAILAEVDEIAGMLPVNLFGFSGGGQFVHRYTMANPQRVARFVVAAAGWYTWPDPGRRFPRGIAPTSRFSEARLQPRRFLAVPGCVLVGANDTHRDKHLRASHWLDQIQGRNRIERGRRWIRSMRAAARHLGLGTEYRFELLPATGHCFLEAVRRGGLLSRLEAFLYEDNAAEAS